MKQPGSILKEETLRAWAEIVIKIWRDKISDMHIWDTGTLYNSFRYELVRGAGDSIERIEFAYELYGYFVDMGVGRDVYVGNPGNVDTIRKRKEWYSRVFFGQVMKLKEIIKEKYGEGVATSVAAALMPFKDLKYAHAKGIV